MARFAETWRVLMPGEPPDLTWNEIVRSLIKRNGLDDRVAAVKIMAVKGDREAAPYKHSLVVMARPYTHRLENRPLAGLRLGVYPQPRQTPLAAHKTLNYLYYLQAGQWAKANDYDEALILNPDGSVSETNTANLLLVRAHLVIRPVSAHVLPGVMSQVVCQYLVEKGWQLEDRRIFPEDLFAGGEVLLTNSLMGAVPVLELAGKPCPPPSDLWRRINGDLL
jgi:para-aminobenzoate synthetase component 1